MSTRKFWRGAAVGALALAFAAACSSQGGAQSQPGAASSGGGGAVTGGKNYTIAMITHEQAGDTFWDKIRAGAKDAAATHGIDLKYSNNENGPENATLVQNAIDSKVDGIALTLSNASQVIPVARRPSPPGSRWSCSTRASTTTSRPGRRCTSGPTSAWRARPSARRSPRRAAARRCASSRPQGSVALETRCKGVKEDFANTENLQVNGADLPSVQSTIAAKLQQDKAITHIVTLGAPIALAAIGGPGRRGQHRPR